MNFRSWIDAIGARLNPLQNLARGISWRVWLGAGGLALAGFWLHDHNVQVRQKALLEQSRRAAAAEVSILTQRAAAKVQAAPVQNAQAIETLEARRRKLDRRDRELEARLASLGQDHLAQARRVATLPTREVATRVAAQLGLEAQDFAPGGGEEAKGGRLHSAASAPGEKDSAASEAKGRRSQIAATAAAGASEGSPGAGDLEIPVLPLSASGARKVESALVDLEACHAESQVFRQRIANCRERAATDAATIERQADSLGKLNQALAAKDRIIERREEACKAELRAVRGTFWSRLGRTSKHVAIGVALGVAIAVGVR